MVGLGIHGGVHLPSAVLLRYGIEMRHSQGAVESQEALKEQAPVGQVPGVERV
jgi:hypothetical protein